MRQVQSQQEHLARLEVALADAEERRRRDDAIDRSLAVCLITIVVTLIGVVAWELRPDRVTYGPDKVRADGSVSRPVYSSRRGFMGWEVSRGRTQ